MCSFVCDLLNPAGVSGGVLRAPLVGSVAEPRPKLNLVHLSLNYVIRWHKFWIFYWSATDQIQ